MINYRIIPVLIVMFLISEYSYAQNSPLLNLSIGIALPVQDLDGELVSTGDSGVSLISRDFIKNNYANSSGVTFAGTLKIPIGKQGYFRGRLSGSYTSFNLFRKSFFGTTIQNNVLVPVSFDSRFTVTGMGIGFEINPFPESRIRPFIFSDITLNLLSMSLIRNNNLTSLFNDTFRMGVMPGAGISIQIDKEYSFVFGGSYHFGNLFFKSVSSSFVDRIVFEREGIPINDKEGLFYSNLSDPDSYPRQVSGKSKSTDWWNLVIGINIKLGK